MGASELMRYNKLYQCVPMRSIGIILLFCASDISQDLIANKATNKFCNWSYFLKWGAEASWHSGKVYIFSLSTYFFWQCYTECGGGSFFRKLLAADRGDLV